MLLKALLGLACAARAQVVGPPVAVPAWPALPASLICPAFRPGLAPAAPPRATLALPAPRPRPASRRMSSGEREALAARYRARPPGLVILDYDRTFVEGGTSHGVPASRERIEILARLKAAGVRVAFSTNRPLNGSPWGMEHLLAGRMTAPERSGLLLAVDGGARVYRYGPDGRRGELPDATCEPAGDAQASEILSLLFEKARQLSFSPADWRDGERMLALWNLFDQAFREAGFSRKYHVVLDYPPEPDREPGAWVARTDKGEGVGRIVRLLREEGVFIEPADVLILGDDFGPRGFDSDMARALPGAQALGVGREADSSLGNLRLLPEQGPEEARAFLEDILE